MQAWRQSTHSQYTTYFKKYLIFCKEQNQDPGTGDVQLLLKFLQSMIDQNYSYSALNSAKAALSLVIHIPEEQKPLLKFFMKGAFNKNPPKPKYKCIWDVSIMLNFLKAMGDNASLSLRQISLKLTMLIALTTGQRVQTIASLSLQSLFFTNAGISIILDGLLKTTTPQNRNTQIDLMYYPDKDLCVVKCLECYLARIDSCRQSNRVLVSYVAPHKAVSSETISRWLKQTLSDAGIDTTKYSAHSTRVAAASKAATKLDIGNIMASVGWKSSKTFEKFYHKPRETKVQQSHSQACTSPSFAAAVLGGKETSV